jgi:hypothetical protein
VLGRDLPTTGPNPGSPLRYHGTEPLPVSHFRHRQWSWDTGRVTPPIPRDMAYSKVMPLRSWATPGSRLQTPGHGLLQGQPMPPILRLMGFPRVTTPLSQVTDYPRVTNCYPRSWSTLTAVGHLE